MKMIDKAYIMIGWLPVFWLLYATVMYALSFNIFYDKYMYVACRNNLDCSTIVLAVFWILCIKEDWGYWASASLIFLSIITLADNVYIYREDIYLYDGHFKLAAYVLAILFWRNEITRQNT